MSTEDIDTGLDLRCPAPTRDANGICPRPSFAPPASGWTFDVAALDLAGFSEAASLRQRRQYARREAPAAPPVPAIVVRCRQAAF